MEVHASRVAAESSTNPGLVGGDAGRGGALLIFVLLIEDDPALLVRELG
jgi:hypothetical protein